ncbi:MAG: aminotransferase class V-fold PLP-dependent enzyme [Rubrivivax sp.]
MIELKLPGRTDLGAWRDLFPVLAQCVHDAPLAYLDNAATTQVPRPVLDAMREFEQHDRANIHRGVHTLSQRATDAFDAARAQLKRFVGAGPQHELVFGSGTTDALNQVAHGLSVAGAEPALIQPGDQIIVSGLEHHANLVPWQQAARRCGATLRWLLPDAQGRLHVEDLAGLLNPRTRVFALTACANATGERPPYEALLEAAADAGALTVLDAAQAVGHDAPDMATLRCDFMAFSGHKMYGPMGTGALVGRRAALERLVPLRYGGDMVQWVTRSDACFADLPARLEGGTPNVAGAVGMAAAAAFIDRVGRTAIDAHVRALRAQAAADLAGIDGVTVLAPHAETSAIVSFVADGVHPHDIGTLLDEQGIAVRTGHHCAQPLIDHLGLGPTTRASFALYNTHDEVERLVAGVARAVERLK